MIREQKPAKRTSMALFVSQLQRSYKSSQSGSCSAQKQSFSQSPLLAPLTPEQRAGTVPISPLHK
jgi:hypothetical protein